MTAESQSPAVRRAVIGTAGHIDHGKTALVRRLTGIDTDRLPEEKKRGISIDLGFAPLVTPAGVQAGIVDVPGHERFVKNMLAGVGGIDLVLLVIAADEGVMPQTREHFAIVKLLGIEHGVIVLTKSDLTDRAWLDEVGRDARALVSGSALADAPLVEFSAATGAGQPELLAAIDAQLAGAHLRAEAEPARLPIDRVFTVEGFGTVVTGTLWRGVVRTGDTLELLPQRLSVRVRRVQVHGQTVEAATAGQRTALALHGVERDRLARGDWLVAPGSLVSSRVIDVRFELLPDMPREWPAYTRVRFHLGASEIIGRLVLLEGRPVLPGDSMLAQMRLEKSAVAARGDRFVIRQYSPSRTIGGGTIIDPTATKRRWREGGLGSLELHESGSLAARLVQQLEGELRPVSAELLAHAVGAPAGETAETLARLASADEIVATRESRYLSKKRWNEARATIEAEVRAFAEAHPARYGAPKGELKSGLKGRMDGALFDAAFLMLIADEVIVQRGELVRPAGDPWSPPPDMKTALDALERRLEGAGFAVPENSEWNVALGGRAPEIAAMGIFMGRLVRVSQDLTYTMKQLEDLRARLTAWFEQHPALTVANFRELTGASRKYAVPLLEHCDRVGWTVRVGDERKRGGAMPGAARPPEAGA
ncbi:MAG: selenocysteine-specific translation elongation factor [Candidatus Eiseniibacteriota bacterium]